MRTGSKFCMYCGQVISDDAKFCPLCGKSQKIDRPEETEKQVSSAVQEKAETMTHTIKNTLADVSQKVQDTDFADKAKSAAHTAKTTWDRAGETRKKTGRKKKTHLFEETTFEGRDAAQEFLDKNAATMKRSKLGLQIAVLASVFGVICLLLDFDVISIDLPISVENVMLLICLIGSLVSYIMAGGILKSIRYSFRIAVVGWFIVPVFPFDLCIGLIALMLSIFAFIFVPIVSVGINYVQTKKDIEDAELFIRVLQQSGSL